MKYLTIILILIFAAVSIAAQINVRYIKWDNGTETRFEPVYAHPINLSGPIITQPDAYHPPTFWGNNKKAFAITGIQLASVLLDAFGDATYDMGKESHNSSQMSWGHTLQASAIGINVLLLPMINWERPIGDGIRMAISYTAMRYALFDLGYNLRRGIDPLYADGLKAEMPPHGRVFTQTIMLTFSVSLNFKEFR